MTMSIFETLEVVQASARTHKNPEVRLITMETTLPIGKWIRQGDVMFKRHALGTEFPSLTPTNDHQMAPGSTVGSRHVLRKGPEIFKRGGVDVLHGPIVVAPNGFYLDHPTHGDMDCRLPGTYEVMFPRDLMAEGLQRRKD